MLESTNFKKITVIASPEFIVDLKEVNLNLRWKFWSFFLLYIEVSQVTWKKWEVGSP